MINTKVEFLLKETAKKLFEKRIVSLSELASSTGLTEEFIKLVLKKLNIRIENNVVDEELPDLIVKAWMANYDVVSVALNSGWSTFEELCSRMAELNGFFTLRNYRFSILGRRHEIDVLAYKDNMLLAIDCKLWHRARKAALKEAAQVQLTRASSLAQILASGVNLGWRLSKPTYIFPLVVNLYELGPIVEEGVLITGLHEFRVLLGNLSYLTLIEMGCRPLKINPPCLF
ncbi:MAG: hypothetical protein LM590_01165 [Thermofilum sp.]|nr:hypothetical protein [Thermofilum sp.]